MCRFNGPGGQRPLGLEAGRCRSWPPHLGGLPLRPCMAVCPLVIKLGTIVDSGLLGPDSCCDLVPLSPFSPRPLGALRPDAFLPGPYAAWCWSACPPPPPRDAQIPPLKDP